MKFVILTVAMLFAGRVYAGTITVKLPANAEVTAATAATEKEPKTTLTGKITGDTVTFADAENGKAYEVCLTHKDGSVQQGVDLGWYSRVPEKAGAEELSDDDKSQMNDVLKKVLSFYNVNEFIIIKGDHNRAVALVQLARESAFHSDKGDEVIWRPELWYFENDHGGWQKPLQSDRVVKRIRFETHKAYHEAVDKLKWVPELGGIKCTPASPEVTVTVAKDAGVATPAMKS